MLSLAGISDTPTVLLSGGELFGIPVVLIVIFVIYAIAQSQEDKQKKATAMREVWQTVRPGLTKDRVRETVGAPQQVIPVDPEVWVYQVEDLKGFVLFEEDLVVGYKTPE